MDQPLGSSVQLPWTLLLAALTACGSAEQSAELRLYEFDCGRLAYDSPEAAGFGVRDDATDVRELFVPCYFIDHPGGQLLWDGGLDSEFAEAGWLDWGQSRLRRLDHTLVDHT